MATDRQGVKILGTPVGHPDFVSRHLRGVLDDHRTLLHCAAARANCQIRCVSPGGVAQFAHHHDEQIWDCACKVGREFSTLPLLMGGLGLRSASGLREPAFWASWADCLAMIRQRHPKSQPSWWINWRGFQTPQFCRQHPRQPDHCMVSWVSNRLRGTHWQLESGPNRNQRSLQPSPCCDHRVALVLVWQCRRAPHVV